MRRPEASTWTSSASMPFAADSLPFVRHRLLEELERHDVAVDASYDVALVLAELVGNALKHARPLRDGGLRLQWGFWDDSVHVSVTDGGGSTSPQVRRPEPTATGGRGLSIVEALSTEWGVQHEGPATTVWALISIAAEESR